MDFPLVHELDIKLGVIAYSAWTAERMAELQQAAKDALKDVDAGRAIQRFLP
jgi:hypothetical protein